MAGAKEHILGVFGRAAPVYDEVEPRTFTYFGRRLVELADLRPDADVLDVAAGKGAVLLPAAERARSVVGVDLAEPMVDALTAAIRARGVENAEARLMDAEHLKFADESFDVVLCGFAIFFADDPDATLAGFRRVLRAGGLVGLTTFDRGDERWDVLRSRLRQGHGWRPARTFENADDLHAAIADAGFEEVTVETETLDCSYDDGEHWLRWAWTHGQRGALERMSPDELDRFKREVFPELEAAREADGLLHNRITAVYGLGRKA